MGKLKPIASEDRRVVNVKSANYIPFISDGSKMDQFYN